ncbi:HGxxPAAW family protein [Cellulomonas sp. HZM]|uniref:HGxxPAAW family protein n=1 Tax=Cellulomonas sp. HZM TaxID=1454010 RepID=UPI0004939C9E|nr:HGxxPAAW family protein [Cellulomonas sp. HZM]
MADNTLAHRAQHPTVTESVHLPPTAPPHNHGKTFAAWFTTWTVVAGGVIAAVGVTFALVWLFWVGLGIALAGPVLGKVLSVMGYGKDGEHTLAREAKNGGHH